MDLHTPADFAQALDRLRRASGKSYRELHKECGLPQSTISTWCKGRHLPQVSMRADLARLLAALGVEELARKTWFEGLAQARQQTRRTSPAFNPYLGLRAFQPENAAMFFGREKEVEALVGASKMGPLAVVGPSGSGKSSLLRAGLIPALPQGKVITPAEAPVESVLKAPHELVLVVDQFEELFTTYDEANRVRFVDALLDRSTPVVIGLRADFYAHAMRIPRLAELLQHHQMLVTPMSETQLRVAITGPARAAGFDLDPGLVELLLRDTAQQPGGLPLLSHTLHSIVETWTEQRSSRRTIDLTHYWSVGGVHGAIAQTANSAFRSLNRAQRVVAQNLFLRLVNAGDSTAVTRRRVTFSELFNGRVDDEVDDLTEVFEVFVAHRLLTADEHIVEISHESLLGAWPLLQEWLAHDRVGHHLHNRLTGVARDWQQNGRQPEHLYVGGTLVSALEWARSAAGEAALNPLEREFLAVSEEARTARREADRTRVRRRYQLLILLVVTSLLAVGAAFYANQVSTTASRDNRLALSREVSDKADRLRDKDPVLAAQLALAAHNLAPTPEARSAVLDSSARPLPRRSSAWDGTTTVMTSAGGFLVFGTDSGHVQIEQADTGRHVADLRVARPIVAIAASSNGSLLAAGDDRGEVTVWSLSPSTSPTEEKTFNTGSSRLFALAFSPDGLHLAAGNGAGEVQIWTPREATPPVVLTGPAQAVKGVAFLPDGTAVAAGSDDSIVHLWSLAVPGESVVFKGPTSKIFGIAVSPDGKTLAAGTAGEQRVYTWNLSDPTAPPRQWTGPASWINAVAFSPDSTALVAGSSDTLLWRWDMRSGQALPPLPHPKPLTAIEFRDSHTILTLATDGRTRTWTVPGSVLSGPSKQVFSTSFDLSGDRLLVGSGDNRLRLWDVTDPHRARLTGELTGGSASPSPLSGASTLTSDGATAIAGTTDGSIVLWRVDRSDEPVSLKVAASTIQSVVLSADDRTAAVGSDDKSAYLVDLSDTAHPKMISSLSGTADIIYGVRFSPDTTMLAVAGGDGKGYLWDIADKTNPKPRATVTGFRGPVYATAFSADGTLVAFGASDYSVRLLDLTHPLSPVEVPSPLIGPVGEVYELSFHPDRRELAVSSTDRTIWLWNLADHRKPDHLATLTTNDALLTLAHSPDGRRLAAGGRDRTVRVWDTDLDAVKNWICGQAGQSITPEEWSQFIPGEPYTPPC
ncbi:High-affnity carbon uptake protein Hat/HatR [Alloactinosynnema sp. L-07]|uniref:nSTAND1 domain-containing NTPase n=1 Tax=Alloactinosynnema sp. L-07 TaxID=1653480 RepID=UPI00065F0365|nr:helix-turn-helix domain-containing protein [Alloactinosynnema sp. L-07]CRK57719.1 High-affnity carbon uptake protein Hat/HatR [Alloactinosynnema sp. L-07]